MRSRTGLRAHGVTFVLLVLAAPTGAGAGAWPASLETRLSLGYDSNLLDASDAELTAFAHNDPGSFFVVSGMQDQFVEGSLRGEWRLPRWLAGRPSFGLEAGRRQYLHNPVRSEGRFRARARLRLTSRTRADVELELRPQVYVRHRLDDAALPGAPLFRPEVYRRWDAGAWCTQVLDPHTSLEVGVEGSVRDYHPPFDPRDRHLAGASAGLARSLRRDLWVGVVGGLRRTWSRNEPGLPDDLSNREWSLASWLETRPAAYPVALRVAFEYGNRLYTSSDPWDQTHFGRMDQKTRVEIQLERRLPGSLASVTRFVSQRRTSNLPGGDYDDDAFSEVEIQTGLRWNREAPRKKDP